MFIRPGSGHPIAESLHAAAALGDSLVFLCPRRSKTFQGAYDDLSARLEGLTGHCLLLVEGVTGDALLRSLATSGAQITALFPANTDDELLDLAPRLVSGLQTRVLLDHFPMFWARGLASLVISDAAPDQLMTQLRRNLYVEDPDGEFCMLRFHDPRVLCRLQETLFDDQAEALFGDMIDHFLFEDTDGALRIWSRGEGTE